MADVDDQCDATDGLGIDRNVLRENKRFTLLDSYLYQRPAKDILVQLIDEDGGNRFGGNVFVVPGHPGLGQVAPRLEAEFLAELAENNASELDADEIKESIKAEQRSRLKRSLATIAGNMDIILIDTPPDLGYLTTTALVAANWYLIPVMPSGYDLKGLEQLISNTGKVRKKYNPGLNLLGVLLGDTNLRANLHRQVYETLSDFFKEKMFKTTISTSVRQQEATTRGLSVLESAVDEKSAGEFRHLAKEVATRLKAADKKLAENEEASSKMVANQ